MLSALVITFLLLDAITVLAFSTASASPFPDGIRINGDSDLAAQASSNGWPGDGSAEHPYLISGLNLDIRSSVAITITGTSLHVVIEDCTLAGAVSAIELTGTSNVTVERNTCSGGDNGIYLESSSNSTVSNNTCSGRNYGIYLMSSSNSTVYNNTCRDSEDGICLSSSSNNTVSNNTCRDNQDGIRLEYSSCRNILSNNLCIGNEEFGIGICDVDDQFPVDNIITNNTCSGSNQGILVGSNNNTVSDNSLDDDDVAIYVSSNNTVISNNTCVNIRGAGIYLDDCTALVDGNVLVNCSIALSSSYTDPMLAQEYVDAMMITSDNTINGLPVYFLKDANLDGAMLPSGWGEYILLNVTNAHVTGLTMHYGGVFIGMSSYATIDGNTLVNGASGVGLFASDHCIVADNIMTGGSSGVSVVYSTDVIVSNNTCSGASYGIAVQSSDDVIVSNNTCSANDQLGIMVQGSINTILSNNTCADNQMAGIMLALTSDDVVSNNNGNQYGIVLQWALNNTLVDNLVTGSIGYGVYTSGSFGNLIYGNAFIDNNGATSTYNASNVQAFDGGANAWNSTSFGNLWSDWNSSSPYRIPEGRNADMLPYHARTTGLILNITSPVDGGTVTAKHATITWTASDASGIAYYQIVRDGGNWITLSSSQTSYTTQYALADGSHTVTVRAVSNDEHYKDVTVVFNVDTVDHASPSLTITSPANGGTISDKHATITWTANDASGIAYYQIVRDGGNWVRLSSSQTSYTTQYALADGTHTMTVRAVDNYGNYKDATVVFTVSASGRDVTPPSLTITSLANGAATSATHPTISWTASDASGIAYYQIVRDGGNWVRLSSSQTSYTTQYALTDGSHTMTVRAVDRAGNYADATVVFTVSASGRDINPPSLAITSPANGAMVSAAHPTVTWTASDASGIAYYQIVRDGGNWVSLSSRQTSYTTQYALANGQHTMTVRAVDNAGNYRDMTVVFTKA